MGWTDEKVETLKILWHDGLSANQIAMQMKGVTRNAVLGKLHRLGLTGRAQPSKPARPVFKAPRLKREVAKPTTPCRTAESLPVAGRPLPTPVHCVDEAPGSATTLTLGVHMCKWPIGDPLSDRFTFCGRGQKNGPYCVEHARVAYQPAQTKRRANVDGLVRSLTRFI